MLLGDRKQVAARTPMPVQDVAKGSAKTQVTSEAVSFQDGAAGTAQRIKLSYDGVMSQYGERIGQDGDSSLSWGTGTVLVTEVPWRFKNSEGKDNETDRLATLADGEYMVDYENGYVLGKNAISTSSSTDTASYKYRSQASTAVVSVDIDDISLASSDNDNAYAKDVSTELESSSVSKSSGGNFYKATGRIDATAPTDDYYFQLVDSASVPSDGSVTFLLNPVKLGHVTGTDTYFDVDAAPSGIPAGSGIAWVLSTTEFTKTEAGDHATVTCLTK